MAVTNLEFGYSDEIRSYASFTWNGNPVVMGAEGLKLSVLKEGYAFLGSEVPGTLRQGSHTTPWGASFSVRGCTDDPEVVSIGFALLRYANSGWDVGPDTEV